MESHASNISNLRFSISPPRLNTVLSKNFNPRIYINAGGYSIPLLMECVLHCEWNNGIIHRERLIR